jgi:hypothetical protein
MNVHRKKSTNKSKGKPEQQFDAVYGTILELVSENFILIFLLN